MCGRDAVNHLTRDDIAQLLCNDKKKPLILAPMAGVTDPPFRALCRRFGADFTVSEMVASQAMIRHTERSLKASVSLEGEPLWVQIAGSDPEIMAQAARLNVERGADIIDINMGCPVKKIIKNGAGAALLRDPDRITAIVEAVRSEVKTPVTVKIRLGWDASSKNYMEIGKRLEQCGVAALTVHGRTRAQMYRGSADWQAIGEVKNSLSIPVIGNGDVRTPHDARSLLDTSNADAVMVGRAAMGYPWIFRDIAHFLNDGTEPTPITPEERLAVGREHFMALLAFHGPVTGNRLARKHLAWHLKGLPNAATLRNRINRTRTPEETLEILDTISVTPPRQPTAQTPPLRNGAPQP
ncbi:MAG: tRNA dihydrouridine synthase DusB [Magnetococcales bacterium]|nr:tRNA dihydrouridine synthase DusB [Magnetococcales bacterium]